MSFLAPIVGLERWMVRALANPITLRLFSNNLTPNNTSVLADFVEVSGGGYATIPLVAAHWGITQATTNTGVPYALATYDSNQDFNFSGPTNSPSVIYGYYITDDATGVVLGGDRLPVSPYTPILGGLLRFVPTLALLNFY